MPILKLNKNDVIIIMRNSKCFDESIEGLIKFNYGNHIMEFKPIAKKNKYYRGLNTTNLTIQNKQIIIVFD